MRTVRVTATANSATAYRYPFHSSVLSTLTNVISKLQDGSERHVPDFAHTIVAKKRQLVYKQPSVPCRKDSFHALNSLAFHVTHSLKFPFARAWSQTAPAFKGKSQ